MTICLPKFPQATTGIRPYFAVARVRAPIVSGCYRERHESLRIRIFLANSGHLEGQGFKPPHSRLEGTAEGILARKKAPPEDSVGRVFAPVVFRPLERSALRVLLGSSAG